MAALVLDDEPAVDPHRCPVVNGAEVQQQALTGLLRRFERPAVPHHRVTAGVVDAAGRCFRWERDQDLAPVDVQPSVPAFVPPDVVVVVRERPGAAQVDPPAAGELRTRVQRVRPDQPLTPERDTPSMMKRWAKTNSTSTGTLAMTAPAMSRS